MSKEEEGEAGCLLTNKKGDYFLVGPNNNFSAYQGLFVFDPHKWEYFKVIDSIYLETPGDNLTNNFFEVKREGKSGKEAFCLTDEGLIIELSEIKGTLTIELDFRNIHEYDERGRIYNISQDEEFIIVEYCKYNDDTLQGTPEKHYLAILGGIDFEPVNTWKQKNYEFDKKRGTKSDLFVYEALRIKPGAYSKLSIGFSNNKTVAKVSAMKLQKNVDTLKDRLVKRYIPKIPRENMAYNCALHSIQSLTLNPNRQVFGILAGRPWFYQFWSRDELISCIYLLKTGKFETMKEILMKYLDTILPDGRIPNRHPHSELGSADGVGWLFKRFQDLIFALEENNTLSEYFTPEELNKISDTLDKSLGLLNEHYVNDNLIINKPKETWMDTTGGQDDLREGARIEIQALHLCGLQLAAHINRLLKREKAKEYEEMELKMHKKVKELFFDGKRLADGYQDGNPDWTCRPNIFIAHYVYPDLLSKREWKHVFKWALPKLWLEWGGLATIEKEHYLFCWEYTGMNNRSYHRGDSWFWINNLAAICMKEVSPSTFKEYIDKIIDASSKETMFSGLIGHGAEVSSAKELRSEGCLCQAWSSALFVELIGK